jgi:hypothetical protein
MVSPTTNFGPKVPGFRFSGSILDSQKPRSSIDHVSMSSFTATATTSGSINAAKVAPQLAPPVMYNDFAEYEKQLRQFSRGS